MAHEARARRQGINEEAAQWVVRLSNPMCSDAERAAFEAWRSESFEHEAAFEREHTAWDVLGKLSELRREQLAPDPDLLAPKRLRATKPLPLPWWAAIAASLVVAVGAAATFTVTALSSPAYATAIGERRVIILSDGSRVELNTNSKIIVRYRNRMRRIELVKGEALFNVAHGAEPLLLKAGSAELRADDSQLTVRLREDGAAITVREGRVAGIPVPAPSQPRRQSTVGSIVANEEAFIGSSGVSAHKVSTEEIDRLLAWRQGAISLNGESLGQAVEEFNRYNKRQLVIADDSIESLRLGGYFQANDPSGFIAAVTKTFPVSATTKADGSIYLARRG